MKPSNVYWKIAKSHGAGKVLYNIAHIENLPSIMELGLLSHDGAASIPHKDISMSNVQARREDTYVTGNYTVHHYANLFFNYENPMFSTIRDERDNICVLVISNTVLNMDGVVLTDSNAASKPVHFYTDPIEGLANIDFDSVFSKASFKGNDKLKHIRGAEVLVPNVIPSDKILHAFYFTDEAKKKLENLHLQLKFSYKPSVFMRRGNHSE